MTSRKIETLVGIFVLAGLACLAYLAINLGGLNLFGDATYPLKARFNSVGNLHEGAAIRIAGVQVGAVSHIELDFDQFVAIVSFDVQSDLALDDDTIASIKSNGLIGNKFIELSPGGSGIPLEAGDLIIDTESAVDIEGLISRFAFGDVEGGE